MGRECQIVSTEPSPKKEVRDHVSNEMNHFFLINFISLKNYQQNGLTFPLSDKGNKLPCFMIKEEKEGSSRDG